MGNCESKSRSIKIETEIENVSFVNKTFDNTKSFSLDGKVLNCRVVDIYDGDTCTCVLYIFENYYKFTIRLADIDTCEMKAKNEDNKKLAIKAKNRLVKMITNIDIKDDMTRLSLRKMLNEKIFMVTLVCGQYEKYGRLLGYIFPHNSVNSTTYNTNQIPNSFNYQLIKEGLAYYYDGKTKKTEEEQINSLKV